ncbi:MAG: hypothetical protein ABL901_16835 [Hyphomicrobiaceae bacterium]
MTGHASQRRSFTNFVPALGRRLYPAGWNVDLAALAVVLASFAVAALVCLSITPDQARLSMFTLEHIEVFSMSDSLPQRAGFLAFLVVLVSGTVLVRVLGFRSIYAMPADCSDRVATAIFVAAFLIALRNFQMLNAYVRWDFRSVVGFSVSAIPYVALIAVFIFAGRLPRWLVRSAMAVMVAFVVLPPLTGLMLRIRAEELLMIDHHMTIVFSAGELLAAGYRLFTDVPVTYGALLPVVLAGALKAGYGLDLGNLVHLAEVFQIAVFLVCLAVAWKLLPGKDRDGREAILFFVLIVVAPYLALSNFAILYPNLSGARYLMLPVAALAAIALERWPFSRASLSTGVVAGFAIVLNPETGIAITAGLGLGWVFRARVSPKSEWQVGLFAGLGAFACVFALAALGHYAILGYWPDCCRVASSGNAPGFAQSFAMGYNGQPLIVGALILVILGSASYVVIQALATLLGREVPGLSVSSVAIAGVLFAWVPYYVARTHHGNLGPYLTLFAFLIAPYVAKVRNDAVKLTAIMVLMLVPVSLGALKNDFKRLADASADGPLSNCAAGLAMSEPACDAHHKRAGELVRIAKPGDTGWMTAYPFMTLRLSRLTPYIATIDPFAASRTEGALNMIAADFRAKAPIALLLDKPEAAAVYQLIPKGMRAIHERIADRAGYAPCSLVALAHWQAWVPKGACVDGSSLVEQLNARVLDPR